MSGRVFFGTREYMQWIKAPAVGYDSSKFGWETRNRYLTGGNFVRRSIAAAKEYSLSWNLTAREDLRPVQDYADGIYGLGPIYYCDPFAMDANMLPTFIAAPFQGGHDAPGFYYPDVAGGRPLLVNTSANNLGYPIKSAQYNFSTTITDVPEYYIPIPPNYTAHVGVHGNNVTGTAAVGVRRYTTGVGFSGSQAIATQTVLDTTRFSAMFTDIAGISLVASGTGSITLSGIMVQLLPNGYTPPTGGFISGQGTSGSSFVSQPSLVQQSAVLDKVGLSCVLVETEGWN